MDDVIRPIGRVHAIELQDDEINAVSGGGFYSDASTDAYCMMGDGRVGIDGIDID